MNRVCIIAEAGVNHNGSVELAKQLVDVAAQAGADAVKFQTFKASKIVTGKTPKAEYQKQNTGSDDSQFSMLKVLELDEKAHVTLVNYCDLRGIQFLSTPFDEDSVDILANRFNLPCLKIASGEITNGPLLLKAAQTKKKIILSTGMANLGEIEEALAVIAFGLVSQEPPSFNAFYQAYYSQDGQTALQEKVKLLHCTTEYPAPPGEVNLLAIDTLRNAFGLPVGYSDHTAGIIIPVAAVARGACMIEKHFTINKELPGPDHKASLEPHELKEMIEAVRMVEQALGTGRKVPTVTESRNRDVVRKSLICANPIKQGEIFTDQNLTIKRPGSGISPMSFWDLHGKPSPRNYDQDEIIKL